MPDNEWTFVADVKEWIGDILQANPGLPFSTAKVEQTGKGSRKRRDLSLLDKSNKPVLTGEGRFPDAQGGQSPYDDNLVRDAHKKADRIGAPYFFTWNISTFVLWDTFRDGVPVNERDALHETVVQVTRRDEVWHPLTQKRIRDFLERFLETFAERLTGPARPILELDARFVARLEAGLERPTLLTLAEISHRYEKNKQFKNDLNVWMREAQGYILSEQLDVLRDNLERAAKFSCYVLVNKLVFYEALRRRFSKLHRLTVPNHITTGDGLWLRLRGFFEKAIDLSGDYETVFKGDFGDRLPFLSNEAVPAWRDLVRRIEGYNFTKLNFDIIGQIFERLIRPQERHKFGQHYTRSELVDLINAFCIRDENAVVFDPACGGGTFLVRAYTRKRHLSQGRLGHVKALSQLYGCDISAYPVHLTILNLATRDLIHESNYPRIARCDFFEVTKGTPFINLPIAHAPLGKAKGKHASLGQNIELPPLNAVVGNPPYVRQEDIGSEQKQLLKKLVKNDFPEIELSGRSDFHLYFWPHAASFLKTEGYYGFLTSYSWLDVEYGFKFQAWLLAHFEILAIFESMVEPWFTGARVATATTILRRQIDRPNRMKNDVRFVQLRVPLAELLENDGTEASRQEAAERFRDLVEGTQSNTTTDQYRIRVVPQEKLWRDGCYSVVVGSPKHSKQNIQAKIDNGKDETPSLAYKGGKWGIYLRAPDLFFDFVERYGDAFIPLSKIAEIRFGIKTGCDKFFFPRDITEEILKRFPEETEFQSEYGISRDQTEQIRIIQAGDGSVHLIETTFLRPEIHSLMEIDSIQIEPTNLKRMVLLVHQSEQDLRNTHVLKYIRYGETNSLGDQTGTAVSQRTSVKSRESETRKWYDLTGGMRGDVFWPMAQQYRHVVPVNPSRQYICNHNLFDVKATSGVDPLILCAVLNSSIVAFFKQFFGRQVGREGNLKTEVIDVNMMLVPDPRQTPKALKNELRSILNKMMARKTQKLPEEFNYEDRRDLDAAIFRMLGETDSDIILDLRSRLYEEIEALYSGIRSLEERAMANRLRTGRVAKATPRTIAAEIWEEFPKINVRIFPQDFVPRDAPYDTFDIPAGKAEISEADMVNPPSLKIGRKRIDMRHLEQASLAKRLADMGLTGLNEVPIEKSVCDKALADFSSYQTDLEDRFRELALDRTTDEEFQEKIVAELNRFALQFRNQTED